MNYFWIAIIIGILITVTVLIIINHEISLLRKQSEQNLIGIIDSENCSFLKSQFGISKNKWIKDNLDNEAIKRMEFLKCQ